MTVEMLRMVERDIIQRAVDGMTKEGRKYVGKIQGQ